VCGAAGRAGHAPSLVTMLGGRSTRRGKRQPLFALPRAWLNGSETESGPSGENSVGAGRGCLARGHDGGMTFRVLLADDDRAIRESLARALELEGYEVLFAADGVLALSAVRRDNPDVMILDVMMPGVDGLGVCRVLRSDGIRTPILMLTAKVELTARVEGLDAGADDYLAKPFELDELLARLRALLRRTRFDSGGDEPGTGLQVQGLRVDPGSRRVWWQATEVELSKTEFDLLELLVRNVGLVLSHSAIYDRIWGYDFGPESKNLAVYISYLRRKLETGGAPPLIRTVRGVGYSISPV
jgi:two-component system response regulator MprA